jgi:hypothetical protein
MGSKVYALVWVSVFLRHTLQRALITQDESNQLRIDLD